MKLIVGLGNPGLKYEKTRHNMGFMIIDKFLREFEKNEDKNWTENNKLKSELAHIEWQRQTKSIRQPGDKNHRVGENLEKVILAKPKTYMNNSGMAVSLLSKFYKIKNEDIWVIHDDLDLELGCLKIRFGGASAGHRGMESIIKNLGTDKFWRFRLGIGHPRRKLDTNKNARSGGKHVEDYVLHTFDRGEMGKARELTKRGVKALETGLEKGLDKAMNQYNTK